MTPYVATLLVLVAGQPAAPDAGRRRAGLSEGLGRVSDARGRLGGAARRGRRGDAARLRAVLPLPGRCGRPGRRRSRRVGLQRRERGVRRALCAECGMVSQLHLTGGGRLTHVVCVDRDGEVIMPCGRCRQLLFENGGPDLELMTGSGVTTDGRGAARMRSVPTTSLDLRRPGRRRGPLPVLRRGAPPRTRSPGTSRRARYLTFDHPSGRAVQRDPRPRPAVAATASPRRTSSRSTCSTATR